MKIYSFKKNCLFLIFPLLSYLRQFQKCKVFVPIQRITNKKKRKTKSISFSCLLQDYFEIHTLSNNTNLNMYSLTSFRCKNILLYCNIDSITYINQHTNNLLHMQVDWLWPTFQECKYVEWRSTLSWYVIICSKHWCTHLECLFLFSSLITAKNNQIYVHAILCMVYRTMNTSTFS